MKHSKNTDAEKICGFRKAGTPLFQPSELGYACPVCGADSYPELRFSEYDMFLWCSRCNIDMPSVLCIKYPEPRLTNRPLGKRQKVLRATEIFLKCIDETKSKEEVITTE